MSVIPLQFVTIWQTNTAVHHIACVPIDWLFGMWITLYIPWFCLSLSILSLVLSLLSLISPVSSHLVPYCALNLCVFLCLASTTSPQIKQQSPMYFLSLFMYRTDSDFFFAELYMTCLLQTHPKSEIDYIRLFCCVDFSRHEQSYLENTSACETISILCNYRRAPSLKCCIGT